MFQRDMIISQSHAQVLNFFFFQLPAIRLIYKSEYHIHIHTYTHLYYINIYFTSKKSITKGEGQWQTTR